MKLKKQQQQQINNEEKEVESLIDLKCMFYLLLFLLAHMFSLCLSLFLFVSLSLLFYLFCTFSIHFFLLLFTKNGNVFSIIFRDFVLFNVTILVCVLFMYFFSVISSFCYVEYVQFYIISVLYLCSYMHTLTQRFHHVHSRSFALYRKRAQTHNSQWGRRRERATTTTKKEAEKRLSTGVRVASRNSKKIWTNYVFHACVVNIFISI